MIKIEKLEKKDIGFAKELLREFDLKSKTLFLMYFLYVDQ